MGDKKMANVNGNDINSKMLEKKEKTGTLTEWLDKQKQNLQAALPKGTVEINRFMQSALLAIYDAKQPLLAKCSPMSIYRSLKESASLGLEVGGVLGQAYLIPYNETVNGKKEMTCHFQMGYKGLIALARRSETIKTIAAESVHENDIFDVQLGMNRNLSHKIDIHKERGPIIAYYCLVELTNGGSQFIVMSKKEIENHRNNFSKAYKGRETDPNNIWNKNFDAMALKTCIIQALKLCPISIEALEAVRKEELADIEGTENVVNPTVTIEKDIAEDVEYSVETVQESKEPETKVTKKQPEGELFADSGVDTAFDNMQPVGKSAEGFDVF